jgi:hypothetical protein
MIVPVARRHVLMLHAIGIATGITFSSLFRLPAAAKEAQPYRGRNRELTTNIRYVRPGGAGRRSGNGWEDAAALSDIDEMIRLVGPRGSIYLLADSGPYRLSDPIWISHGAKPAACAPDFWGQVDPRRADGRHPDARYVGRRGRVADRCPAQFARRVWEDLPLRRGHRAPVLCLHSDWCGYLRRNWGVRRRSRLLPCIQRHLHLAGFSTFGRNLGRDGALLPPACPSRRGVSRRRHGRQRSPAVRWKCVYPGRDHLSGYSASIHVRAQPLVPTLSLPLRSISCASGSAGPFCVPKRRFSQLLRVELK